MVVDSHGKAVSAVRQWVGVWIGKPARNRSGPPVNPGVLANSFCHRFNSCQLSSFGELSRLCVPVRMPRLEILFIIRIGRRPRVFGRSVNANHRRHALSDRATSDIRSNPMSFL